MANANVYDSFFASSMMVGNVAGLDVTATTWFGSNIEYVHGIQIMPLTPATALLLQPHFVRKEWPLLNARLKQADKWRSAGTRSKGHGAGTGAGPVSLSKYAAAKQQSEKKECAQNPTCVSLGLTAGDCCPTAPAPTADSRSSTMMLACCDKQEQEPGLGVEGEDVAATEAEAGGSGDALLVPIADEWRSLLHIDQAVVKRDDALLAILAMDNFGNGNSKTNSLMWAISRPKLSRPYDDSSSREPKYVVAAECARNSACVAMGMGSHGNCCPAPGGWNEWGHFNSSFLGCCPKMVVPWS
jgi:hypothetical protein